MAHFQGRTTPGGLIRVIGPQAARRQLRLSLGLLGILAVASAGAAFGLRPGPVDLTPARRTELGEEYLRRAAIQRHTDKPRFVDKMPNNWLHVALIRLILPNATIIDARRHPLACGFSNFKQHFARGQGFSYDLADMGRYYADYVRLMAHLDHAAPGRVHRVLHEAMIEQTEAEVRALLAACQLPFEPGCLAFHETARAVRTASSEQVRRPINRDGADVWRTFAHHLGPLEVALGPVLTAYPAAPAGW